MRIFVLALLMCLVPGMASAEYTLHEVIGEKARRIIVRNQNNPEVAKNELLAYAESYREQVMNGTVSVQELFMAGVIAGMNASKELNQQSNLGGFTKPLIDYNKRVSQIPYAVPASMPQTFTVTDELGNITARIAE